MTDILSGEIDVVDAVQRGDVDRGVIPFENSSNGTVIPTLDTLSTSHLECSDLMIAGETAMKISHCLLIRSVKHGQLTPPGSKAASPEDAADPALPRFDGSTFDELRRIKHIYSHPQALGQCRDFLAKVIPWAVIHDTTSTAEAANIASKDLTNSSAALGSAITARQMGLQILMEGVQDVQDNSTRFLVLKKDPLDAPPWHTKTYESGEQRSLLVSFCVNQSDQGKLVAALSTFDKPDLQLKSVHSRPSRVSAFDYIYFVEVGWRTGRQSAAQVDEALVQLGKVAQGRRCHGSWGPKLEW